MSPTIAFERNLLGVRSWLLNAKTNTKASVNWYKNNFDKSHGGGTNIPPNCEPLSMYSTNTGMYFAAVKWLPKKGGKHEIIGEDHSIKLKPNSDGSAPTLDQFYDALIAAVDVLIAKKK